MKTARIYLRVSTQQQSLVRQNSLVDKVKSEGYYIAGVYREKASGARTDRPELLRMIADLARMGDLAAHVAKIARLDRKSVV